MDGLGTHKDVVTDPDIAPHDAVEWRAHERVFAEVPHDGSGLLTPLTYHAGKSGGFGDRGVVVPLA